MNENLKAVLFGMMTAVLYFVLLFVLHWFLPFDTANDMTASILLTVLVMVICLKFVIFLHHAPRDKHIGIRLLPETSTTRSVWWRADRYGLYLMFFNDNDLMAGMSFQYPECITRSEHIKPGFSMFSWGRELHWNEDGSRREY